LAHICEHKASAEVLVNGGSLGFNIRPYAAECLLALRKQWEIIVFSSSDKYRADAVLDYLDPSHTVIDHRLYRSQALLIQDVLVKDLRLLAGRDLRRTIIVDNTASAFAFQLDSGVPIKTWRNSKQDTELLKLLDFMAEMLQESDMRLRLRRTFDLAHLKEDFAKAFSLS
jgi:CTD small phosphatase-like protein 2